MRTEDRTLLEAVRCGESVTHACRRLGLSRAAAYMRLKSRLPQAVATGRARRAAVRAELLRCTAEVLGTRYRDEYEGFVDGWAGLDFVGTRRAVARLGKFSRDASRAHRLWERAHGRAATLAEYATSLEDQDSS